MAWIYCVFFKDDQWLSAKETIEVFRFPSHNDSHCTFNDNSTAIAIAKVGIQVLMLNLFLMFGNVGNKSMGLSNLVDMQNNHYASKRQMSIWSMIMCWNEQVTERVPATEEFFRRRLLLQTSIGDYRHDYHLWIVLGRYHDNYHLQTMIVDYPDIKPPRHEYLVDFFWRTESHFALL